MENPTMITTTTPASPVALVTGAFGRIGHATALMLAAGGWRVYAAGRDLDKSTALVARARASGLHIVPIVLDVTDERSIETGQIAREAGRLDVLVNNCGQPRISRSPAVRQVGALLKPACAAPWRLNGKPFAGTSASSAKGGIRGYSGIIWT
jgi:NAD(P)-dependent dehydrogenase (short-subunit alcohol dehydrogenase family)